MEKLLTRKQVAALFSVTTMTVRNWQVSGILKAKCIINGRPRYSQIDIDNMGR